MDNRGGPRTVRVALVQFDALPERIERNLSEVERLTRQAVAQGARWVVFHEGTLSDYTRRLKDLAEPVPGGKSTLHIETLAQKLNCFISFGLSENDRGFFYMTQAFAGPQGFVYKYRKTWLYAPRNRGYRNEADRYDPGSGPERFIFDGVKAACFSGADGLAPRCIERTAALTPQLVVYPNNVAELPAIEEFAEVARKIHAPMLVTNRVGGNQPAQGGCAIYSAGGAVLARANRQGKEEILIHALEVRNA